jgi:hypothetical protein
MSTHTTHTTTDMTTNNISTTHTTTDMTTNNMSTTTHTTTAPRRKAITLQRVIEMCERDEYEGICLACGEDQWGVEPDARRYECDNCGKEKVYGCQELILMVS